MGSSTEVIVLGVDPGGTTGLCLLSGTTPLDARVLFHAQVPVEDMPRVFRQLLGAYEVDYVALERFTISGETVKKSRTSAPMDMIGGVKWECALTEPPVLVVMQSRSDAKTAYPNERLIELGIDVKGPHAKDAAKHALLSLHARHNPLQTRGDETGD